MPSRDGRDHQLKNAAMNRFNSIFITVMIGLFCQFSYGAGQWPVARKFDRTYHIDDVNKGGFDVDLRGSRGKPIYKLSCHSGEYEDDSGFNYSGLFQCRLSSLYSKEKVSTLLTETVHQSTDWQNRGRFLAEHLRPGCAQYPEWGDTRTFRLRGMKLTLSVRDINFIKPSDGKDILQSFTFSVSVRKDNDAQTSIARAPETPEPPWFYGSGVGCSSRE